MAIMTETNFENQGIMDAAPVVTIPTAVNPSPTPTLQSEVKEAISSEPQKTPEEIDAENRAKHEAAEAKRKAEWEAKKKARDDETLFAWEQALDVPTEQLADLSVKRLGDMTEKLTQRNMKLCVTEHIQTLCFEDVKLAQYAMHPKKSMINCFKFINEKALEYLKEQRKLTGEKDVDPNVIGGDIPDGLCYEWAKEYFMNLDAEVDKTEEDKDFVPQPYRSSLPSKPKKKEPKKKETAKKVTPPAENPNNQMTMDVGQQVSMLEGA